MFTPLLSVTNDRVAFGPGGNGGLCVVFELAPKLRLDLIAGFGGMGSPGVFGGVGPGWSAGLAYSLVNLGSAHVDLGFRMLAAYQWESDNARADPGIYLAFQVFSGFTWW